MLGHLSEQNNHPAIVQMVAAEALERRGLATRLSIADAEYAERSFSILTIIMIPRYTRPEMGRIWSDQNKFQQWLEVELAASEALARTGRGARGGGARCCASTPGFDVARIHEIESEVKHDVIAFTTAVAETMAARGHARSVALVALRADVERRGGYGAGAAAASRRRRFCCGDLSELREVLKRRALEFQHTVQIGRTHGVHAEPITFGLKLAIWYEEAGRDLKRLERGGGGRAGRQDVGRGGHVRAHRRRRPRS